MSACVRGSTTPPEALWSPLNFCSVNFRAGHEAGRTEQPITNCPFQDTLGQRAQYAGWMHGYRIGSPPKKDLLALDSQHSTLDQGAAA